MGRPLLQLLSWLPRLTLIQHQQRASFSSNPPASIHVGILSPPFMPLPPSPPPALQGSLVPGRTFPWGSLELMAVPKRKVSRSRKGIRNGPKALKPHPVIIKCKSCGRVKLPHFYCCSGEKKL